MKRLLGIRLSCACTRLKKSLANAKFEACNYELMRLHACVRFRFEGLKQFECVYNYLYMYNVKYSLCQCCRNSTQDSFLYPSLS